MGRIKPEELSPELRANAEELLRRVNIIRAQYGKPMKVSSGYRSKEDHIRVYKELAVKRGTPFELSKVPMGSKHLSCQAVDISDPDGSLFNWVKQNEDLVAKVGLWMEEKDDQKRVHFQTVPPKSGKRFFSP